ncbi:RPA-related protein RADX isoform X2 [Kryptolebias marmoratus]|uniref:RPA-related protein RADX isoform X2 n=1 Tax=Kryptolebias marmoratus TaxID=37003 RepID=UPI0018ACF588|nr:RPA-related protein RADX isoform X2 [Kryptolebias marmoratus]
MAADSCVFHRTLTRSRPTPNKVSSPVVCREFLHVVDIRRYSRDQASPVFFPQAVLSGEDLYDVTLTDGHCLLQVTLDPGLNRLVERRVLHPGSVVCNVTFSPALSAQLPECPGASADRDSYRLVSVQVRDADPGEDEEVRRSDWATLPWFGSSEPTGPLVPLRANRSVFLPLWNNVDHSGEVWREAPPTDEGMEDEDEEEDEGRRPAVTVSELRDVFLSGWRGAVQHQLIVRIINKSHLMYYGRTDRNCDCPYKVLLQVSDQTGSVCVVLWNSVCVDWYRCLKPGDIISLRRYRVKRHYQAEGDDIELSVNSRNPAALISVLPESSVSPEHLPPAATYSFYSSKDLSERAHSGVCDVIGLLAFTGRSERIRRKDGRGAELLEYRWLRLEDGSSDRPIMVKLFSTSQPETHLKLHPLSVVVCTRLQVIRSSDQTDWFYLTNTTFTQVYCTGLGHHSQMSYRKLPQVRLFLRWLRSQEDEQVLSRALIGGFFIHPPPPVSLETFMKDRRGELGFLQGAELQRELERLCYRERRSFCVQATVTMVTYSSRGEEDHCLFWTDRASSHSSSSSSSSPRLPPSSPSFRPSSSSPPSFRPSSLFPPSSPSFRPSSSSPPSFRPSSLFPPSSPSSAVSHSSPGPAVPGARKWRKRRQLLQADTLKKRRPQLPVQAENNRTDPALASFNISADML